MKKAVLLSIMVTLFFCICNTGAQTTIDATITGMVTYNNSDNQPLPDSGAQITVIQKEDRNDADYEIINKVTFLNTLYFRYYLQFKGTPAGEAYKRQLDSSGVHSRKDIDSLNHDAARKIAFAQLQILTDKYPLKATANTKGEYTIKIDETGDYYLFIEGKHSSMDMYFTPVSIRESCQKNVGCAFPAIY